MTFISPIPQVSSLEELDWGKIGLKVGLEIHRQLEGHKLFCNCPSTLSDSVRGTVRRRLIPRLSETGSLDAASVAEAAKKVTVTYELTSNTCPVEIDEDPPLPLDHDQLLRSLRICLLLGCDPVDSVQFMRKIVIDGSNPSGFQRTALIGLNGSVSISDDQSAGIATLCLEEDAGRRMPDSEEGPVFRLDRAGTPEVEISTEPCLRTPEEAIVCAKRIGDLLKATGSVRRGIGSVRQDVNVSVMGGERVEVKLVQDLPTIGKVVKFEAIRHLLLSEVSRILKDSSDPALINPEITDVTEVFSSTACKVISSGLSRKEVVLGIKLLGFAGLMGDRDGYSRVRSAQPDLKPIPGIDDIRRLGPEFAGYVKASTGLKGLFHSDELPGYGMTQKEVDDLAKALGALPETDGFVIVCSERVRAEKALHSVIARARMAFHGVVPEVRRALPDGRTEFMRPISGSARMYPETDVPRVVITTEMLKVARSTLPEDPVRTVERLNRETGIAKGIILQMQNEDVLDRFSELIGAGIDPKNASYLLMKGHEVLGERLEDLPDAVLKWIALRLSERSLPKEATERVLRSAEESRKKDLNEDAILSSLSEEIDTSGGAMKELEGALDTMLAHRMDLIKEKGLGAIGPLMGPLMKTFRGRVEGSVVESELRKRVQKILEDG